MQNNVLTLRRKRWERKEERRDRERDKVDIK